MEVRELEMHEKIAPKRNRFGIWGRPLGYRPMSYIFRKTFSCATFVLQNVCLYLEPLRSYFASKLTILEKYSKIQHMCPPGGSYMGAAPTTTSYTLFESSFYGLFASQIVCLCLEPLKIIKLESCRCWNNTQLENATCVTLRSPSYLLTGYEFVMFIAFSLSLFTNLFIC